MTMTTILSLADSAARDERHTGNKAAILARLLGRGFPVPAGVVVTTARDEIDASLLVSALQRHKIASPWAVRSSSTAEDGTSSAFPGVFATVLGVADISSLVDAVTTVRLSGQTRQVQQYAAARGIPLDTLAVAILIQRQLDPRAAGVAFSRDPVSGADVVCIEANYGLGQTVVDGTVTPDSFRLGSHSNIIERSVGSKREQLRFAEGRLRRHRISPTLRARLAISDGDAIRIAALARQLERVLGAPQDIEWALVDRTLHLLQARPITTMREV